MSNQIDLNIVVTSLSGARRAKRKCDAVLTIEDPLYNHGLRFHKKPHPDHLILMFEDVDFYQSNIAMPDLKHVEAAIDFGREHVDHRLLVHCKAGIARSTAIALAIIADRLGKGNEPEAVKYLLQIRNEAAPNLLLLDMIDDYLNREGRLKNAWLSVENAHEHYADHRKLKREILEKNPALYREPFSCLSYSAWRYRPTTLIREAVIKPDAASSSQFGLS